MSTRFVILSSITTLAGGGGGGEDLVEEMKVDKQARKIAAHSQSDGDFGGEALALHGKGIQQSCTSGMTLITTIYSRSKLIGLGNPKSGHEHKDEKLGKENMWVPNYEPGEVLLRHCHLALRSCMCSYPSAIGPAITIPSTGERGYNTLAIDSGLLLYLVKEAPFVPAAKAPMVIAVVYGNGGRKREEDMPENVGLAYPKGLGVAAIVTLQSTEHRRRADESLTSLPRLAML